MGSFEWETADRFSDRLVFQTREWVGFVAHTQHAEPVVAKVLEGGTTVGYFTGLVQRRVALPLLGSPMPGWTTPFMGFNLEPDVSRVSAVEALVPFALRELRCVHLELHDRYLGPENSPAGFTQRPWTGLEVDLAQSEDAVWATLKAPCRTAIRKAQRHGVVVEEASDLGFADEFYEQLRDVFAKQALVPPYGVERIRDLIRIVHPTGRLLLLRARSAEGDCIATGIFPAMNRTMHFLAGASLRRHQHVRPNEALMWYALMYWKRRGVSACDLGGFLDYKRKWGGHEVHVPSLSISRFRALSHLRDAAERAHGLRRAAAGRLQQQFLRRHPG